MDGIEATRIIREEIGTEYAKNVPIIALTANAIVGNEEMFLKNGFQAFLSKPVEITRLDAVIREWVQDEEIEKQLGQVSVNGELVLNTRSDSERRKILPGRRAQDLRSRLRKINGLDANKGLERFNGDEESYIQVLHSYVVNTQPLLEIMKKVNKDNLHEYVISVHGIKGSSRGICATELGDRAEALEKAAREGKFDYLTANNEAFIEEADKLLDSLDNMLNQIASKKIKTKKDKPESGILKKLFAACSAYNMDEVDNVMAELEAYDYESDDGLAAWLRKNVDKMNFTEIKEKLAAMQVNGD
jgi:CheY-like chemotaxis protein